MKNKSKFIILHSIFIFSILVPQILFSQNNSKIQDSINKYSYLDFMGMKEQLGISIANRPGPSGNPNDSNAANSEEKSV